MEITEVGILKNNVAELQRQLQQSYIRIKELREELDNEKDKKTRCMCGVCGAEYVGYYPGDIQCTEDMFKRVGLYQRSRRSTDQRFSKDIQYVL